MSGDVIIKGRKMQDSPTLEIDDAFSTGTGLESAGFAGPVCRLWALNSFVKTRNKKGSTGVRPLPLRCLSQFFPVEENINCLGNEVLCICFRPFHHDNFPNLIMILNSMFPNWIMILNSEFS